ncbi:HalOD1 output domain-containing protein [Natrialbaceae archaeon A-arb3/5]
MTERRIRESYGQTLDRSVQYEPTDGESPSIAVATALARYHGEDATETSTRLYDHIDPEALDALFAGTDRSATLVEFDVGEVQVAVRPDRIGVTPRE